jgi:dCMP deaminase
VNISFKWVEYFFGLAKLAAAMSKDPKHKVGAIIIEPRRKHVVGTGYNGFARGVLDLPERYYDKETKLQIVIHAETNAILDAGRDSQDAVIFTTTTPCPSCASLIIQSGIKQVCSLTHESDARHGDSIALTKTVFTEAGVLFRIFDRTTYSEKLAPPNVENSLKFCEVDDDK